MMQRAPALQQFGHELASIHMLGRQVRWVTAMNMLVSLPKCSWGGPRPYPTAPLFRGATCQAVRGSVS